MPYVVLADLTDREDPVVVLGIGTWDSAEGPGKDASVATLALSGDAPRLVGWGDCQLTVALPAGQARVAMTAPDGGVDRTTRSLVVGATERDCTGGRDLRPHLTAPVVVETEEAVTVRLSSESPTEGGKCPGVAPVPVTVELSEPLGDRTLLDGGTWPATPVQ